MQASASSILPLLIRGERVTHPMDPWLRKASHEIHIGYSSVCCSGELSWTRRLAWGKGDERRVARHSRCSLKSELTALLPRRHLAQHGRPAAKLTPQAFASFPSSPRQTVKYHPQAQYSIEVINESYHFQIVLDSGFCNTRIKPKIMHALAPYPRRSPKDLS